MGFFAASSPEDDESEEIEGRRKISEVGGGDGEEMGAEATFKNADEFGTQGFFTVCVLMDGSADLRVDLRLRFDEMSRSSCSPMANRGYGEYHDAVDGVFVDVAMII